MVSALIRVSHRTIRDEYRPTDDEPFMCSRQRAYFRGKLFAWRNEIPVRRRKPGSTFSRKRRNIPTLQIARARRSSAGWNSARVIVSANSLPRSTQRCARLDDGTYGYCEETGEPISLMQLDARPVATLSVEAQERHERRERFYSND